MKRFLVFNGDKYYPLGGWGDFRMSCDTLDEAKDVLLKRSSNWDWAHIVDSTTGEVVWS